MEVALYDLRPPPLTTKLCSTLPLAALVKSKRQQRHTYLAGGNNTARETNRTRPWSSGPRPSTSGFPSQRPFPVPGTSNPKRPLPDTWPLSTGRRRSASSDSAAGDAVSKTWTWTTRAAVRDVALPTGTPWRHPGDDQNPSGVQTPERLTDRWNPPRERSERPITRRLKRAMTGRSTSSPRLRPPPVGASTRQCMTHGERRKSRIQREGGGGVK